MAAQWYYYIEDERRGPVTSAELKKLAISGRLEPDDHVWKPGMDGTVAASSVKGLRFAGDMQHPDIAPVVLPSEAAARAGFNENPRPPGRTLPFWLLSQVLGGSLLIAAFCLPWWKFEWTPPEPLADRPKLPEIQLSDPDRNSRIAEHRAKLEQWQQESQEKLTEYYRHIRRAERPLRSSRQFYRHAMDDAYRDFRERTDLTALSRIARQAFAESSRRDSALLKDWESERHFRRQVWGWKLTTAIVGMVFGTVIVLWSGVAACIPAMRRWAWIGSLIGAILGVVAFVTSLIWFTETPGKDVPGWLQQDVVLGPYIAMPGGMLAFFCGIGATAVSLRLLVKRG